MITNYLKDCSTARQRATNRFVTQLRQIKLPINSSNGLANNRASALGSQAERLWSAVFAALLIGVCLLTAAAAQGQPTSSTKPRVHIHIDADTILRTEVPDALFGFNIHYLNFQQELTNACGVALPNVVDQLKPLAGAIYRYPGGLVSNHFNWHQARGPLDERLPQKNVRWQGPTPVSFGVSEFLNFVQQVDGKPWYVLNLRGFTPPALEPDQELSSAAMAESNAKLATYIRQQLGHSELIYYELGNELDRADYQWSHQKYIQRAQDTIAAISKVDPNTKFVAFLRDFTWRYRDVTRKGQVSSPERFIKEVLTALPMVNDFSLHYYYDDPGLEHKKTKWIPWRTRLFKQAIKIAKAQRPNQNLQVWITEHARGVNLTQPKPMQRVALTSNLQAAISTADFLATMVHIPQVQGAALHGLNAGPWQVFDASAEFGDRRARPTLTALTLLRETRLPNLVASRVRGPNLSSYGGGYDVSAAAFASDDQTELSLWAINRANRPQATTLSIPKWANQQVTLQHNAMQGPVGGTGDGLSGDIKVTLAQPRSTHLVNKFGQLPLELPALSINGLSIRKLQIKP